MTIEIIDGELVDTYGGDYTYKYVYAEVEDGEVIFYEYCLGAKEMPEERVYDADDIAEYMALYNEIMEERNESS
jgi:hypothetical protein